MIVNFYNTYLNSLITNNGVFQFLTDEIKVLLVTSGYTFDADMTTIFGLEGGDEVSGTGYTAGGKVLSGKSKVGLALFADNVSWTGSTFSAAGAIIYKSSGGPVMAHIDFEGTHSPAGEEFQLNWDENGIFVLTTD